MDQRMDRVPVTHIGSLPRPSDLLEMARHREDEASERAYADRLRTAVSDVVNEQVGHGIDIVSDGELSKPSFIFYVHDRLGGFELLEGALGSPWAGSREAASFPDYYAAFAGAAATSQRMACTGPVTYEGHTAVQTDLDNLTAATRGLDISDAPMRCTRSTRPSWTPGSCCRSTTRSWSPTMS